jgi:ABC-type enterochelin transport system substrate-binding protein
LLAFLSVTSLVANAQMHIVQLNGEPVVFASLRGVLVLDVASLDTSPPNGFEVKDTPTARHPATLSK